jgi:hypothetical protein
LHRLLIFIFLFYFFKFLIVSTPSRFSPTESEESDEEDGTGNVTRMVMRPPGHSGKAKKGLLADIIQLQIE